MIVFELACVLNHRFEGWFASADDFDAQRERGILQCPVCGASEVNKIPYAKIAVTDAPAREQPFVTAPAAVPVTQQPSPEARFKAVAAFVARVLAQTEDVGRAFPEEARRIHYEEAPSRPIRGQATPEETRDLLEEGIEVLPLPVPPEDAWN